MNTRMLVLCLAFAGNVAFAPAAEKAAPAATAQTASKLEGTVAETINAAGYTYLLIDTGGSKVWAAAPELPAKAGDRVVLADPMRMANYHSKTLNRTFETIYFSGAVTVNGKSPLSPADSPARSTSAHAMGAAAAKPAVDLTNIPRAPNGKTVAEIHAAGASLAGKSVVVRDRVVKFNGGIMGRNWLHVRDGSGAEGTNDLTVTTQAAAKVGDLVVVTAVLAANRDFGAGYKYPLILEDATVVVE